MKYNNLTTAAVIFLQIIKSLLAGGDPSRLCHVEKLWIKTCHSFNITCFTLRHTLIPAVPSILVIEESSVIIIIIWRLQIKLTSPQRLWEDDGGPGNTGILGLDTVGRGHCGRNLELFFPWRGNSWASCWHHAQTNWLEFLHVCNYSLLRNGVFPCAVSLGLALDMVLLSILLLQKPSISHLSPAALS